MPDHLNEFDQIFRDRLQNHSVTPPDSVWSNIQAERSFGHIIANKISSSWRIIGTILLLTLAGGSSALLLSDKEQDQSAALIIEEEAPKSIETKKAIYLESNKSYPSILTSQGNSSNYDIPLDKPINEINGSELPDNYFGQLDPDLLVSGRYGGFSRPQFNDAHMAALTDRLQGWETARPASAVRFYEMEALEKKEFDGNRLVKSPLLGKEDFDYVIEANQSKKGFWERASLNFFLGPQFINKMLTAEYNMETSFLEKRKETENTRLAYTAGIGIRYELKNHKFLESGLQFTQIYEEVHIDGEKRFSNQYDFLEIPILIGFENRESKWGWEVKGGLGYQFYNHYKGYILKNVEDRIAGVNQNEPEPTSEYRMSGSNAVRNIVNSDHKLSHTQDRKEVYDLSSEENPYRKQGVVNLHLAAGITYFHSINTSFSLMPYYRQSINSITKENAVFKERISSSGILLGTRIKF